MIRGVPMQTCRDCKSESREANCQCDVECCRAGGVPQSSVLVTNMRREGDGADYPRRQPPRLSPLGGRSSTGESRRGETGNEVRGGHDNHDPNPSQATCLVQWASPLGVLSIRHQLYCCLANERRRCSQPLRASLRNCTYDGGPRIVSREERRRQHHCHGIAPPPRVLAGVDVSRDLVRSQRIDVTALDEKQVDVHVGARPTDCAHSNHVPAVELFAWHDKLETSDLHPRPVSREQSGHDVNREQEQAEPANPSRDRRLMPSVCKSSRRCRDAHRGSQGRKMREAKHSVSALRRASASAVLSARARLSRGAPAATTLRPVRFPADRYRVDTTTARTTRTASRASEKRRRIGCAPGLGVREPYRQRVTPA